MIIKAHHRSGTIATIVMAPTVIIGETMVETIILCIRWRGEEFSLLLLLLLLFMLMLIMILV